ncbi:MAG: DUF4332 domain-containing protein [Gammaproteobacteria bacterium]
MTYKIQEIEGIGPAFGEKLAAGGINTTADLLKLCCDSKGRKDVSDKTGLREAQLLQWANKADLMRVSGIGSEFSDLLEATGVDTVKELKMRRADNLAAKMVEVNKEKKLCRAVPSETTVAKWIEQAKAMVPAITY